MMRSYLPVSMRSRYESGRSSKPELSENSSTCSSIGKTRRMLKRLVSHRVNIETRSSSCLDDSSTACDSSSDVPRPYSRESKKVRFAQTIRRRGIPSRSSISREEWHATWYTENERIEMKSEAKMAARRTAEDYPIYVAAIKKTMSNAFHISVYMNEMEIHKLLRDTSKLLRYGRALREWSFQEIESLRGLESWVVKEQVTTDATKLVLGLNRRDEHDLLAYEYREATKTALIHARLLGEIDASAARKV